jgi:hypothetical protein
MPHRRVCAVASDQPVGFERFLRAVGLRKYRFDRAPLSAKPVNSTVRSTITPDAASRSSRTLSVSLCAIISA